eukprot:6343944-Pyramimonas_sp.AAC.1
MRQRGSSGVGTNRRRDKRIYPGRGPIGGGYTGTLGGIPPLLGGEVLVKCRRPVSFRTRLKVRNTRSVFKVCCTSDDQRRRPRAPTLNY